ncbi:MAG TPA: hypothetical protein VF276_11525 [Chloroflexia bacterium]
MLKDYNTAAPPSPLPAPGLWRWVRDPAPATVPIWANRILRLLLAAPLLWWLYGMVSALVWRLDPAYSGIMAGVPDDLIQADMLFVQVNIGAAALGLAVLALWRWQPRIARGLLLGFGIAVLVTLCAFFNVLSHSRI